MSDKETIINIRKNLYEYLSVSYKACISINSEVKTNPSLKTKYIFMLSNYHHMVKYYTKINASNSLDEIRSVREEIIKEISTIRKRYAELKQKYDSLKSKNASKTDINSIVNEMNSIVNLNKMMNEFVTRIDSYLKKKNVNVAHINTPLPTVSKPKKDLENKPKEIKETKEETKEEAKQEKKQVQKEMKYEIPSGKLYEDKNIRDLDKINKTLCQMKRDYYKLDRRSPKAEKLRKKIYDWCKNREIIMERISGIEGVNTLINMESIEDTICSKPELPKRKPYTVDSHEYNIKFDYLLSKISDLKFNSYDSKYYTGANGNYREYNKALTEATSEYEDLIKSVSDLSKSKNIDMISTDILSLLNVYNIDGDYLKFKDANNGGMIGGEKVSLESYREGINRINDMKASIKNYTSDVIKRKGGTITITDHSDTKEKDEQLLQTEREKLYRVFLEGKKKYQESNLKR